MSTSDKALALAVKVAHALILRRSQYIRSIFGDADSRNPSFCPRTALQLAPLRRWRQGLPALARILVPPLPPRWSDPEIPFADFLVRPSSAIRYPEHGRSVDPTQDQRGFFINGIGTDRAVVLLNAHYLRQRFRRPLTVFHNDTRGLVPDLAA